MRRCASTAMRWVAEVRRTENEKGRFTLVFLAAPGDEPRRSSSPTTGIPRTTRSAGRSDISLTKSMTSTRRASDCRKHGVTINRPPRDGRMAFVRSPDKFRSSCCRKVVHSPRASRGRRCRTRVNGNVSDIPAASRRYFASVRSPSCSVRSTTGAQARVVAWLFAQPKHANLRGSVHGGVLATDCRHGAWLHARFLERILPAGRSLTANLTIDYAGSAKIGDWMHRPHGRAAQGQSAGVRKLLYPRRRCSASVRASGVFLASDWPRSDAEKSEIMSERERDRSGT